MHTILMIYNNEAKAAMEKYDQIGKVFGHMMVKNNKDVNLDNLLEDWPDLAEKDFEMLPLDEYEYDHVFDLTKNPSVKMFEKLEKWAYQHDMFRALAIADNVDRESPLLTEAIEKIDAMIKSLESGELECSSKELTYAKIYLKYKVRTMELLMPHLSSIRYKEIYDECKGYACQGDHEFMYLFSVICIGFFSQFGTAGVNMLFELKDDMEFHPILGDILLLIYWHIRKAHYCAEELWTESLFNSFFVLPSYENAYYLAYEYFRLDENNIYEEVEPYGLAAWLYLCVNNIKSLSLKERLFAFRICEKIALRYACSSLDYVFANEFSKWHKRAHQIKNVTESTLYDFPYKDISDEITKKMNTARIDTQMSRIFRIGYERNTFPWDI